MNDELKEKIRGMVLGWSCDTCETLDLVIEKEIEEWLNLFEQYAAKELNRIWKVAVDNNVAGAVKWELEDRINELNRPMEPKQSKEERSES